MFRYCRFSPDGLKLASGGKDKYVNIFDFDPESMTLKFARSLDRYNHSVAFFAWSPDSTKLAVCGPEDCDEVRTKKVIALLLQFLANKDSCRTDFNCTFCAVCCNKGRRREGSFWPST